MGIQVNLWVFRQNESIKWFCIFDQIWYEKYHYNIINKRGKKLVEKS